MTDASEAELRNALAHEIARRAANPMLRSMYPSKSRGEMSDIFEDKVKQGWDMARKFFTEQASFESKNYEETFTELFPKP